MSSALFAMLAFLLGIGWLIGFHGETFSLVATVVAVLVTIRMTQRRLRSKR